MAALVCGALRAAGAQGTLLIGDVVAREAGNPLGHSMVTVVGADRQTFTSESGVFAFSGIEPGKYRVRIAHIGYIPTEVNVTVPEGGAAPRIRVELMKLTVQLATVRVIAKPSCTMPGRPNPELEPDFFQIITQVRLNAEQFQLLSDSFPFGFKVERTFYKMRADSSRVEPRFETVAYRSDLHGWTYKLGEVIERERDGQVVMHLPTLRDFASFEFLNNHCFHYAGLDSTRDGTFIRITFQAHDQIKTPDVSGAVYLDAKTFQIRRAELELTKIPPSMPEATAVRVTTIFGEVSPSIDIIQEVHGITSIHHWGWFATVAMTEDQRMFAFEWLKEDPAHPAVQP